jgi:3-hydroxyisobutyrate dehydrogenase-like beta-hydroxyacid dehydrogenase
LLANDDGLVVFDVRPEACEPLVKRGARHAESLADVVASADVVSVMVRDDAQVREVVAGLLAALPAPGSRPDLIIAVHSTIHASTAVELEADAARHGVALVDAPVSGGAMGAHEGTLAALVGGTDEALERCRPVFAHWASLVVHFGPVGAGTHAKLARNLLTFAAYAVVGESQRLAEAAGIDLMKLGDVVRHTDRITGGPGAIMLRTTAGAQEPGDDWYDTFSNVVSLGEKDLALALGLAHELGVELPLGELAFDRLAPELGVPHSDHHERHP